MKLVREASPYYTQPQGGIYAISINNEIMVKRIQLLYSEGKLAVISDNKNYERLELDAGQVYINGIVLWYCREMVR
ncbi:MAG: S24 family peptidase [Syntrophales bacterium]